ncbi:MAG: glycosyltransferase family 4 protein [Cyclonatronaceae bacterium]
MLKILFLSDNFPPEVTPAATRTYEHCREWVKLGADVTVLTSFPNFPRGKLYEGYKHKRIQRETIDGIKVVRVWTYLAANTGFVRRTVDYLSYAVSSFFAGLYQQTDIIIATSPHFFITWSGAALSFFKKKPWVFEIRDLWPESIKSVEMLDEGLIYRILERIEMRLYQSATHIIPNTDAFKKRLVERGVPEDKISVIPNGTNFELFIPMEADPELKSRLGLQGKFIVGYIGTLGLAHALDFVIESIARLNDNSIHFLFIGDGAVKDSIMQRTAELNLKNVSFLDPVPKNDIPRYLALVDASLAPLKKTETFKTVIPSKIFEAGAMGKPMLLGVDGQARSIVEAYGSGLYFEPENTEDFITKVKKLAGDRELQQRLGEGGKKLARAFDRKKLAAEMLDVLKKVAQSPRIV